MRDRDEKEAAVSASLPRGFKCDVVLGAVPVSPRVCWVGRTQDDRGNDPYMITNTSEDGRGHHRRKLMRQPRPSLEVWRKDVASFIIL